MKIIFKNENYIAQVNEQDGHCVVHRVGNHYGAKMSSHVGEKLPSQDWKEVTLYGCPLEIRNEIVTAWNEEKKRRREARACP